MDNFPGTIKKPLLEIKINKIMTNEEKSTENEQTPNSSQTVLSRKMRKILDSQLETDLETQEALKELSTFFDSFLKNELNTKQGLHEVYSLCEKNIENAEYRLRILKMHKICDDDDSV